MPPLIVVFGMNARPFWYEWDRGGAIFRFLLSNGVVFTGGRMTPPPPLSRVLVGNDCDRLYRFSGGFNQFRFISDLARN